MMIGSTAHRCGILFRSLAGIGAMLATITAGAQQLPPEPREAAATLSRAEVPAQGDSDVLLTVQQPGRIRIRAESSTGVALQFVDMMVGPGAVNGDAGIRDGAVDELADKGVYKIRSFGDEKGKGNAKLTVQPYRNAAPASTAILRGGTFSADLADLQQRSFWLIVGPSGWIEVDAGGRALQDLVLWRNGTDRTELQASPSSIEPKPGRGLTLMRLSGRVEPGLYLVTAYGGPALPWVDGARQQPFHIRAGEPDKMAGTAIDGTIGPLGFVRLAVPAPANYIRLELPDSAPARLLARRGGNAQGAEIRKNSRNPVAAVNLPTRGNDPAIVEVFGQEGQPFRLRALPSAASRRFLGKGPYLVGAGFAEAGGEEAPAMAVFADIDERGIGHTLYSDAPRIGGGSAWRGKFNLRGTTTLIFEVTKAGPIAAFAQGPNVTFTLEPLLARSADIPRRNDATWDVEPGLYWLTITPVKGAGGILDLSVGPLGVKPDAPLAIPVRLAASFGQFDFAMGHAYQLFTSSAPGQVIAPQVRPLPLDLGAGAVTVLQPASATVLRLPILMPAGGSFAVTTLDGKPVMAKSVGESTIDKQHSMTVEIPASDKERFVTIAWAKQDEPLVIPTVEQRELPALDAGKVRSLDLERGQNRSFRLDVAEGGLYRVETTGRLKTGLTLGTAFLPKITEADDNGIGHNALLQTYLRAGSYRVNVRVADSDGHLGLTATPAPLPLAGTLVPGGSIRTTLSGGSGAVFDIIILETGTYSLDLYGLNRAFTARLEDAEGWPLTVPDEFEKAERKFTAGKYRLVVQPEAVDARAVARLSRIPEERELTGHGPHPVAFNETQSYQWREPEGKDAARDPDIWTFSLAGPAHARIDIGDGMAADLIRQDVDGPRVARIVNTRGFAGELPAGRYALEARALGRNDRLDYELTVAVDEIQPGQPRHIDMPAKIPFALAQDRVVNLATFGGIALKAVLKDASGREIERMTGRDNDWNIALSRYLAAGAYVLELDKAQISVSRSRYSDEDSGDDGSSAGGDDSSEKGAVEVNFSLPEAAEPAALAFTGQATVTDARVHSFTLPQAAPDTLVLLAAQSASEIALSVEKRDTSGRWHAQGFARSSQPLLALPADTDKDAQWRISVWRVDGGTAPITVVARNVSQPAQAVGTVKLEPVAMEGFDRQLRVAMVNVPGAVMVHIKGRVPDLVQGSAAAKLLRPTESGALALQSDRLWLVTRDSEAVTLEEISVQGGEIALELGDGEWAEIPPVPAPEGKIRVWRADSSFGQPSFLISQLSEYASSGLPQQSSGGIASGSALAVQPEGKFTSSPVSMFRVRNGEKGPLRLTLKAFDLDSRSISLAGETSSLTLPPHSALTITLADELVRANFKHATITLEPNLGAILPNNLTPPSIIWTANDAVSREIFSSSPITFVNVGDKPASASLVLSRTEHPNYLDEKRVFKRFFGTAGSLQLRVGTPGARFHVIGAAATFVGTNGSILRGTSFTLPGWGAIILDHPTGLVAAWIENDTVSPWPNVEPLAAAPPQTQSLAGPAQRFTFRADTPALLNARTNAPVILTLNQDGRQAEPELYPAGAEFHGFIKAGDVELRLDSPYDGPLSGTLDLSLSPIPTIGEGLGEPVALAPGTTALFGFEVKKASTIGAGVRAEPDTVTSRILDAGGKPLGTGAVQMQKLVAGHYYLEVRALAAGGTVTVRPAVIGIEPPPSGPPADIRQKYLDMVGKTAKAR